MVAARLNVQYLGGILCRVLPVIRRGVALRRRLCNQEGFQAPRAEGETIRGGGLQEPYMRDRSRCVRLQFLVFHADALPL